MHRHSLTVVLAAICTIADAGLPQASGEDANATVLRLARAIKNGGGHNKAFSGSGTPKEIRFKKQRILSKATDGTYCSGFTFTVVMDAAESLGTLSEKTVDKVKAFQRQWYGTTEASRERQCVVAVEGLGIGKEVSHDEAKPGDFVQFWRKESGHSAVLLEWIIEGGQRVGLKYRSSQAKTDGVGDHTEYFADAKGKGGAVDRKRTYFCRLTIKPSL